MESNSSDYIGAVNYDSGRKGKGTQPRYTRTGAGSVKDGLLCFAMHDTNAERLASPIPVDPNIFGGLRFPLFSPLSATCAAHRTLLPMADFGLA